MMSKRRGSILLALGMVLPFVAQSSRVMAEGPTISGYVDTQYNYDFSMPSNNTTFGRAYDAQHDNFANTAHLSLSGMFNENTNYVVDIDAGRDAQITSGGSYTPTMGGGLTSSAVILQEAYVNYVGASKLGFKVGKFATYEGIEVIETNANPTITRGYLYGFAEPFTHVGGVVTYAVGALDFAAGVVNGWDATNDNNAGKTVIGKIGLNLGDKLTATLSGTTGPEQAATAGAGGVLDNHSGNDRDSVDLTLLTKIIPSVDLFIQGNIGTEKNVADFTADGNSIADDRATWKGVGIQPVIHFSEKFSLGARVEYMEDSQGVRFGNTVADGAGTVGQQINMTNFTITPGYKINDNLMVRAEYRYDTSNRKVFSDDSSTTNNTVDGGKKDSTSTGAVQFVVSF